MTQYFKEFYISEETFSHLKAESSRKLTARKSELNYLNQDKRENNEMLSSGA